ncbi:MAG TPA: hypothetical protein VGX03_31100 [Candidatus Binatia bacterium]|nr:hypothetical protein [Candidatus Binatia bacterium]
MAGLIIRDRAADDRKVAVGEYSPALTIGTIGRVRVEVDAIERQRGRCPDSAAVFVLGEAVRDRHALQEERATPHVEHAVERPAVDDRVLRSGPNDDDVALDVEVAGLSAVLAPPA